MDSAILWRRQFSTQAIVVAIVLATMLGCPYQSPKNDRWKHYRGGGHFIGGSPVMAADGTFILYASPRSGHGDIYRTSVDGNETMRLTESELFESSPVISPDGKQIAFLREVDGQSQLWTMHADGTHERKLTGGPEYSDMRPMYSPDSQKLHFSRSQAWGAELNQENEGGFLEIGVDGMGLRRLADRQIGQGMVPSWISSDEKRTVSLSNDYTNKLFVMNVDGSATKHIAAPQGHKSEPLFCLSDTHIIVRIDTAPNDRGDGSIFLINIRNGTCRKVTNTK